MIQRECTRSLALSGHAGEPATGSEAENSPAYKVRQAASCDLKLSFDGVGNFGCRSRTCCQTRETLMIRLFLISTIALTLAASSAWSAAGDSNSGGSGSGSGGTGGSPGGASGGSSSSGSAGVGGSGAAGTG